MPAPTLPKRSLKKITRLLAPYIPLAVYRRTMPRHPVGFFYHAVSDAPLPHVQHLYPAKTSAEFEQDLLYLKRHFTLLAYPDLFSRSQSPNHQSAFLSFDDGFAECYTVARPLLLQHQIPCLFFLATNWIDNRAMYYRGKMSLCIDQLAQLDPDTQNQIFHQISAISHPQSPISNLQSFTTWILSHQQTSDPLLDQVCELLEIDISGFLRTRQPFLTQAQILALQADGFVIGAHTRSHPKLSTLPQEAQATEIVESCRIIADLTGQKQVPFAFPFSGNGVEREFLAQLRAEHPHIGLIFDTQKLRRDRPFIFHRIWADKPVPGVPPARNIEHWLKDAYVREMNR